MTRNGMLRFLVALAAIACPVLAGAQVYKCVDRNGRVTYQQQPCPDAPKEQRLDIFIGNRTEAADTNAGTDPWAEQVGKKIVVAGMPRATVMRAVGSPQRMRAGTGDEDAAEVWVYRRPDLDKRIGFQGGVVIWIKEGSEDAAAIAAAATRLPRAAVIRGMNCGSLEDNLGPAASVVPETDQELRRPVVRYTFPSTPPENERTIVICEEGVVARVDRILD